MPVGAYHPDDIKTAVFFVETKNYKSSKDYTLYFNIK